MNAAAAAPSFTIKGFRDGLLVTICGEDWNQDRLALLEHIATQKSFFQGARLAVDVGNHVLRAAQIEELKAQLSELGVFLTALLSKAPTTLYSARMLGVPTGLFNPKDALDSTFVESGSAKWINHSLDKDEIITAENNLVILGDVNEGAYIETYGSIIIWGALKGNVHAGIGGNENAVVCAVEMKPTKMRIANILFKLRTRLRVVRPEIAHIHDGKPVIDPWNKTRRKALI